MTISTELRKAGPFTGNGVTTAFPFSFKVFAASDVAVTRADTLGAETALVLNSDFTVALNPDQDAAPGGTITLAAPLATGHRLAVSSVVPNLQPTDITNNGGFYPRVIEDALDRHVAQIQQIDEKVDRALKVAVTSPLGDQALPSPAAGMLIGWNESNDGLKNYAPIGGTLLGQQLAAANGSSLVGFQQAGAGAVVRTAQDKMREWVSVKDFGAVGDGVTNDTAAVQIAVDYLNSIGGGTLFFPAGTYYVSHINYYAGITFQGVGSGSKLKKIPSTDKFNRMFTTLAAQTFSVDSPLVAWYDLAFDGNSANHIAYQAYQLEQAHMIFLVANAAGAGRLRAIVEGCTFENCVADAVSVYNNVNLEISNCFMRECFRGGLVITGGYTIVKADNLDMFGVTDLTRMDIEVDGAGYGGTYATTLQLSNIYTQNGFDLGGANMTATLTNIVTDRGTTTFGGYGGTGDIVVADSRIALGVADTVNNRIDEAKNLKFQNCQFTYHRPASAVGDQTFGMYIYWHASSPSRVLFQDCEFFVASSVLAADTAWAVYGLYNAKSVGHQLIVDGCRIPAGFDGGIYNKGGTTLIRDTEIDAVEPVRQDYADASGWEMTINNVTVGPAATKWIHIATYSSAGIFHHYNVTLDESKNVITTDYGFIGCTFRGRRVILGTDAPTLSTQGMIGDLYRKKVPTAGAALEWVCIGTSGADYVWKVATTLAA